MAKKLLTTTVYRVDWSGISAGKVVSVDKGVFLYTAASTDVCSGSPVMIDGNRVIGIHTGSTGKQQPNYFVLLPCLKE